MSTPFNSSKTCRFRKYFLQVLLFPPRVVFGKSLLRGWEERAAGFGGAADISGGGVGQPQMGGSLGVPQHPQLVAVFHNGQTRLVVASPAAMRRSRSFANASSLSMGGSGNRTAVLMHAGTTSTKTVATTISSPSPPRCREHRGRNRFIVEGEKVRIPTAPSALYEM